MTMGMVYHDVHSALDELGGEGREPLEATIGKPPLHPQVSPLDIAELGQGLQEKAGPCGRPRIEDPQLVDPRRLRRARTRRREKTEGAEQPGAAIHY
jgi:hypothetical protein